MNTLQIILFLARQDLKSALRERSTLMWLFIMPGIFFFFIGSMTGGGFDFGPERIVPVEFENHDEGFLGNHLEARLTQNGFYIVTEAYRKENPEIIFPRVTIPVNFTSSVLAHNKTTIRYIGKGSGIAGDYDFLRLQKASLSVLADILAAEFQRGEGEEITADLLAAQLAFERTTNLNVTSAGRQLQIPTGFQQAIPGTLVMFTLLVLLTSGATALVFERENQLLRRLASAPFTRGQIVAGKWAGRMALATVQIGAALLIGTFLFGMNWGENLGTVVLVLFAWGAFCTSLAILLGSIGKTEGQVSGLGVLTSMVLAALGGCWWPIEVAPDWMQELQMFLPTGWTMDALHKLISFGSGPESVLPNLFILLVAALATGWLAAKRFRFV